ncbi:DUF1080 domain-containing protein [Mucilaginibacter sp. Bleaf8]|uniref:3-keto-disaccharide hydrolase n=1 Tax=Mucilaginibacter sp. Bleaf8 TaxID=2834430 RepID=UPI001BD01EDD|nr:DUF1080 domain-containing protein [Mucilaginibacter sp. Bleaf8]MBS7566374.1 DUF1080 domain-containing protein [Mucilaginibacter sp. Bleaf8]
MINLKSTQQLLLIACAVLPSAYTPSNPICCQINQKQKTAEQGWINLLDKNLSRWGTYLSYNHQPDYAGKPPVDASGKVIAPVGYNSPTQKVFTMTEQQGQPVLHVSGELYGCVYTKQDYENFHLKLKVKWGDKAYGPRVGKLKDSGILYYSQGEAGVDYWRAWMLSQEFQIMEGHMGDYWNIANSAVDIRAYLPEGKMNSIASTTQPFLHFGTGAPEGMCLRSENHEKPGEWNTLELICYQGKSLHIVNGHVVMVLQNSHYVEKGQRKPLTKGKIQLQSEGCEAYFKEVQIKNLTTMPGAYQTYFN